MPCISNTH